jgi:membrane-associated PAP2 superfamily phosphatase
MNKLFSVPFATGLLVLLLASLPFAFSNLDLTISAAAFCNGNWNLGDGAFWTALYRWGTLPGLCLGICGLAALLGSWIKPAWETWRKPAAVILVTLLLGPGLLVNVLGKGYWGRPRPREVISLGGTERFQRLTEPGLPGRGKSFPAGHPSVGYLFCVLFFLDPGPRRRWLWLGGGLGYGTLLGAARVLQGAHFTSDVLWSGGFTYLSAAWAARAVPAWFPKDTNFNALPSSPLKKGLLAAAGVVLVAGLLFFFMLATPFYKQWEGQVPGALPRRIILNLPAGISQIYVEHQLQDVPLQARVEFQGFGFPKLKLKANWDVKPGDDTWQAQLRVELQGWVTEKKSILHVGIRPEITVILDPQPGSNSRVWIDQKAADGQTVPAQRP